MKRLAYNHDIVESGAYIRIMTHYAIDFILRKGEFQHHLEEFKSGITNLVHLIID